MRVSRVSAGEFSLARDDLSMELLGSSREAPQSDDHRKCSTLGESRMKTQGSMMGLTEMKMSAIRSSRWDSLSDLMVLMYTRIWGGGGKWGKGAER